MPGPSIPLPGAPKVPHQHFAAPIPHRPADRRLEHLALQARTAHHRELLQHLARNCLELCIELQLGQHRFGYRARDRHRRPGLRRLDMEQREPRQQRAFDPGQSVGRGNVDRVAGVKDDVGRLVPQHLGRLRLQHPVQCAGRPVVKRVTTGSPNCAAARYLVQLVQHDHRVGHFTEHDQAEQLPRFGVGPMFVRPGQRRDGFGGLHRVDVLRHPQHVGQPGGKTRLAQTRQPDQQHGRNPQRRLRELAQRAACPHMVDDRREVRHALKQPVQPGLPGAAQRHRAQPTALRQQQGQILDALGVFAGFAQAQGRQVSAVARQGLRVDHPYPQPRQTLPARPEDFGYRSPDRARRFQVLIPPGRQQCPGAQLRVGIVGMAEPLAGLVGRVTERRRHADADVLATGVEVIAHHVQRHPGLGPGGDLPARSQLGFLVVGVAHGGSSSAAPVPAESSMTRSRLKAGFSKPP